MDKIRKALIAIITRVSLILLGLTLGVIILELIFRWQYPDPSPKLVNQALQFHDVYGIAFTPNTAGWNTSLRGEYSAYIQINNKGLRGQEYPYQKPSDTFRILVLGDSFTAALQVKDQDLFTSLLREQFNQASSDKRVEVINAGVVGYGTANELSYFMHEGYKYASDVVILMFFAGNDVLNNINPPHYKIEDGRLIPIDLVYRSDIGVPPWAQDGTIFRKTRNYLYTHSRLYSVTIELLVYALIQQSPQLSTLLQSMGFVEATRPVMNAGNIYSFLQPPQEAWTMTEALLIELHREIQSQGSQLIVVIIPDETEVDPVKWDKLFAEYPTLFDRTGLNDTPTTRLEQLFTRHAIPHLQLRTTFQAHQSKTQGLIYYPYDGHWTPLGHHLAAQVIYDYFVQDDGWLEQLQTD